MNLKKIGYRLLLVFTLVFAFVVPAHGQEAKNNALEKQQIVDYEMSFFDWEEIDKLQESLKASHPITQFDLKEEVIQMIKGEKRLSVYSIINMLGALLFEEIGTFLKLGVRFILIVLLCSLLEILSSSFQSSNTTKVSFFVCYVVVLYSVIQSFLVMTDLARTAIDEMSDIMFACIPSLIAFMTTTGYISSSAAIAPIIVSSLHLSTYVIKNFILPCIVSVILLEVISTMSDEFKIDKLVQLFYRSMKWVLNGILVLSVSVLGLYNATLPYVDTTLKKAAVNVSSAFMPVIGDAVGGAVDFIVNCSFLIKNAFSAGVILWIVIIVSMPLIKILSYVIIYHVAAAAIEPIGDKKMAQIATKVAKGCEFIMSCVGIVALLCIVVLLICISVGGNMI